MSTGVSATAMIEALIDGERRSAVLADLSARGRLRTAGKMTEACRWLWPAGSTDPHALMCRLHLNRIQALGEAVAGLTPRSRRWRAAMPGGGAAEVAARFGDVVVAGWLARSALPRTSTSPPPEARLLGDPLPGNYMSAKKSKGGRTGDGGNYIKALLVQAAWAAVRVPGLLQPGSTGWSAGSAAPGTKARSSARSSRSPTPC